MEGNLKEIVTFLEGNFAKKREIGRKPYVPKVEALDLSAKFFLMLLNCGSEGIEVILQDLSWLLLRDWLACKL